MHLIKKNLPGNEISDKVIHVVEKILKFSKQQKGKQFSLNLACVAKVFVLQDSRY